MVQKAREEQQHWVQQRQVKLDQTYNPDHHHHQPALGVCAYLLIIILIKLGPTEPVKNSQFTRVNEFHQYIRMDMAGLTMFNKLISQNSLKRICEQSHWKTGKSTGGEIINCSSEFGVIVHTSFKIGYFMMA